MFANLISTFRNWLDTRASLRQLERMDDDLLRDIGITRATIKAAVLTGLRAEDMGAR